MPEQNFLDDEDAWTCARCGDDMPVDFPEANEGPDDLETERHPGGALLIQGGAAYCAQCAANLVRCRVCGCTDECACDGGCYWVELDLCSVCEDNIHNPDL